jgi:hypothetical protein
VAFERCVTNQSRMTGSESALCACAALFDGTAVPTPLSHSACCFLVQRYLGLGGNRELRGRIPTSFGRLHRLKRLCVPSVCFQHTTVLGAFSSVWPRARQVMRCPRLSTRVRTRVRTRASAFALRKKSASRNLPICMFVVVPLCLMFRYLAENGHTGNIPTELFGLQSLSFLILNDNDLRGPLPNDVGQLAASLHEFKLQGNSNFGGTLPTELGMLTKCTLLFLGSL